VKRLFVATNAIVTAAALSCSMLAQGNPRIAPKLPLLTVGRKIMLSCMNPVSHQAVGKDPTIANTTGKMLKKGANINWSASDGDEGVITLDKDLAPNGTVTALGNPGQSYTCQAWTFQ